MISVIIPTLNEEKLLPNLLDQLADSELIKKYDYEIIVSDGGSVDKTIEIALDKGDKVIANDTSGKQNISIGRNTGANHAEGDWLIFLNGDVLISSVSGFFDVIYDVINSNKYKGITFSVRINPEEELCSDKLFLMFYNFYFHLLNVLRIGMSRGECMVIEKNIFEKLGGFNEVLAAGEDFDLFKRLRKLSPVYFCHKVKIYESPRRYRKYGHWKILFTWLINALSVIFVNKSVSKKWEEVR